ncbi:MAG: cation diffusion facilitator family transporter [Candidatus Absconditabacteria bacterium]
MSPEKKAISIASGTAAILAITKLTVGIFSGSMALISSAVDSLLDLIVSFVNLLAVKTAQEGPDAEHNYGHGKVEGIAALFEGLLILTSGGYIIYSAIDKILNKSIINDLGASIGVMIFSILMTGMVVFVLSKAAKKTNSLIVRSDLMHYKTDFLTNTGVIISLIVVKFTGFYLVDQIVAIGVAIYIIIGCIPIMKEGFDLIMDKSIGRDKEIIDIIMGHSEIENYHMLQTRRGGKQYFVNVHLVFIDKEISLRQAHTISDTIERQIKKLLQHKTQVMIHLDPHDDSDEIETNPKLN